MNRIKRIALICAVLWLTPQAQASAQAATYLNEAVQALQSGNVYVSAEVTDINSAAQKELAQQANANHVAVVALPAAAASEAGSNPTQFAVNIATRSGKDTLVVSIGGDLVAVSRNLPQGAAEKLASKAEADSGSTSGGLLTFISEVRDAQPKPSSSQPIADTGGGSGLLLVALVAFVALAAAGFGAFRYRRQAPVRSRAPDVVKKLLSENRELGDSIKDSTIRQSLSAGQRHTEQLFLRLNQAGSNQIQETTATYAGHLKNLRGILVQLKDIEANPEYYEQANLLLQSGRDAVRQYEEGALKNTQEVTSGSLTDFRVNAKLLAAMNPASDPKL